MNTDIDKVEVNLLDIVEDDHHLLAIMTDHDRQQQGMPLLEDPVVVIDGIPEENPLANFENYYTMMIDSIPARNPLADLENF